MALIRNSYEYTDAEKRTLRTNPVIDSKDWEKSIFKKIKLNLKQHLTQEQNQICPYCGLKFSVATCYPHIEHIVHKDNHLDFMFEPKNLAISCPICNVNKGRKETLTDSSRTDYPTEGSSFVIIHPHFDNYSEHIELFEQIFLKAITGKGRVTIDYCNLCRMEIAEEMADQIIMDRQGLNKKLVLRLTKENDPQLKNQITNFIENS